MLICVLAARLYAQQPANEEGRSSFRVVDIYVDSKGVPLAAYQLKIWATNGNVRIVGIEGGEHEAFREAPFYDPKAIQNDRVIIGAFNTSPKERLPMSKTRVASLHIQTSDKGGLQCMSKLMAAAGPDGVRITAEATWEERKNR
jgi:hypothetical protein